MQLVTHNILTAINGILIYIISYYIINTSISIMLIDNCIVCQLVLQHQTGTLQNLVDNRSFYFYKFLSWR